MYVYVSVNFSRAQVFVTYLKKRFSSFLNNKTDSKDKIRMYV